MIDKRAFCVAAFPFVIIFVFSYKNLKLFGFSLLSFKVFWGVESVFVARAGGSDVRIMKDFRFSLGSTALASSHSPFDVFRFCAENGEREQEKSHCRLVCFLFGLPGG
jgi:hypothetical protein